MSEQIREQISAFLDGELPGAESELLLKRMLRDSALRDSFGRYALIGEAMRGMKHVPLRGNITGAINGAIDGEPARPAAGVPARAAQRWWRTLGGAAVAASVAVVGVVALQLRTPAPPLTASVSALRPSMVAAVVTPAALNTPAALKTHDAIGDVSPNPKGGAANALPGVRLTNYVFAHSQYPSLLGQRDVMTDLIVDVDQPNSQADASAAR
jgi:sigma-E factor negative regulatory protein RseA